MGCITALRLDAKSGLVTLAISLSDPEKNEDFGTERLKEIAQKLPQAENWHFSGGSAWASNTSFLEHFIFPSDDHSQ